jgi:NhaP-type Na+/H+ or K+/H+ antiporter
VGGVGFRRSVGVAAALILTVEAVGVVLLNIFLGMVVHDQRMSLAGLEPRSMSLSADVAGVLFGCYLLLCAALLVRTAVRDAAPTGVPRIVLISAAVVHGLLGAACVGLVGWLAFVFMMVVLGLIVWSLVSYPVTEPREKPDSAERGGDDPGSPPAATGPAGPAGPHPEPSAS